MCPSLLIFVWLFYRVMGSLLNRDNNLTLFIVKVVPLVRFVRFVLYCIAQLLGAIAASALFIATTPGPLSFK